MIKRINSLTNGHACWNLAPITCKRGKTDRPESGTLKRENIQAVLLRRDVRKRIFNEWKRFDGPITREQNDGPPNKSLQLSPKRPCWNGGCGLAIPFSVVLMRRGN